MPLSPTQSKLLKWGVPAVGALVLVLLLVRKSSASTASTTAAAAPTGSVGVSSGGSIGLGQLSTFENTMQAQLAAVAQSVQAIQSAAPVTSTGSAPPPTSTTTTGTTVATPSPVPTPPTPGPAPTPNYTQVSANAALNDLSNGQTLYQSGAEAIAWDIANGTPAGQSIGNIDPNAHYALSPAAAAGLAKAGKPVYAT